jgi:hypothetical protein
MEDNDIVPAPKLIEVVFQNCRGQVDHWVEPYLRITVERLNRTEKTYLKCLFMQLVRGPYYKKSHQCIILSGSLFCCLSIFTIVYWKLKPIMFWSFVNPTLHWLILRKCDIVTPFDLFSQFYPVEKKYFYCSFDTKTWCYPLWLYRLYFLDCWCLGSLTVSVSVKTVDFLFILNKFDPFYAWPQWVFVFGLLVYEGSQIY